MESYSTIIKQKYNLVPIIKKYKLHQSILKIRETAHFEDLFYLKNLKKDDLENESQSKLIHPV